MALEDLLPIVLSVIAFCFSVFVFWFKSPAKVKDRSQDDKRSELFYRTLIFGEQLLTLYMAVGKKEDIDPYLYRSLRISAKRLEDVIDEAIKIELWPELLSSGDGPRSMTRFTAFLGTLQDGHFKEEDSEIPWTKKNLIIGMDQIYEVCARYSVLAELPSGDPLRDAFNEQRNQLGRVAKAIKGQND